MLLLRAEGTACVLALDSDKAVQDIDVTALRTRLKESGCYLGE